MVIKPCMLYFSMLIINLVNISLEMPPRDFVFPDELENLNRVLAISPRISDLDEPPKCANGSTFCENIDSYPYEEVRHILHKKQVPADGFETDKLPIEPQGRIDDGVHYLCNTRASTIFPKIGKTTKKKWKYIINQPNEDGYVQGIVVETCFKEGEPCALQCDLKSFITTCKQKYTTKRLFTLTPHGEVVKEYFLMPSTCVCTYKRRTSPFTQFKMCRNRSKPMRSNVPFTFD